MDYLCPAMDYLCPCHSSDLLVPLGLGWLPVAFLFPCLQLVALASCPAPCWVDLDSSCGFGPSFGWDSASSGEEFDFEPFSCHFCSCSSPSVSCHLGSALLSWPWLSSCSQETNGCHKTLQATLIHTLHPCTRAHPTRARAAHGAP